MKDEGLTIDESYIEEMAEHFERQGRQLQKMADAYIVAMRQIVQEGIVKGETSETLMRFTECAEKLHQVIQLTAEGVRDSVMNYLEEVDAQDQYLF